jgi:germination protein M
MRRFWIPLLVAVAVITAGWIGFRLGRAPVEPLRRETRRLAEANRTLSETEVAVFFIKTTKTDFFLKPLLIKVPVDGDRHLRALEAFFDGPPAGSGLDRVFPEGSRALRFELAEGLATVDLNRTAARINVGASGEALAVAALVNTLTKLPDVYRVKILVEGEEVESLAGHVDLSGTFGYNDRMVQLK